MKTFSVVIKFYRKYRGKLIDSNKTYMGVYEDLSKLNLWFFSITDRHLSVDNFKEMEKLVVGTAYDHPQDINYKFNIDEFNGRYTVEVNRVK